MVVSYEPLSTTHFLTNYQLQQLKTYGSIEIDSCTSDIKGYSYRDTGYDEINFCKLLDVEREWHLSTIISKAYSSIDAGVIFVENMTETYLLTVTGEQEREYVMKRLRDYKVEIVGNNNYIRVYRHKHGHKYLPHRRKITYKALRNLRMYYIRKVLKGRRKG